MDNADKLSKKLSNAFKEASNDIGTTFASLITGIGASVNSGSVLVTAIACLVTGGFSYKAANSFAKGLDKPIKQDEPKAPEQQPG